MKKVLLVHNYYLHPGGEDTVFAAESSMLAAKGHTVLRYTVHNRFIEFLDRFTLFAKTLWNRQVYRELRKLISEERPEIVHFHNTFPLISPAAYYAARQSGAAVVQTLHNFRLLCPEARMFRNGATCELCIRRRFAWPSIRFACYQKSRAASSVVAIMLSLHRTLGTWKKAVDAYIALTEFARWKICEGDIAARRVHIKPNFLANDPGAGRGDGGYILFAGRLSAEKGLDTLFDAMKLVKNNITLKVVGDGPMRHALLDHIQRLKGVEYAGQKTHEEVLALMKGARMLVVPSVWYEGFPMTIVEAFASGCPVIASRIGSLIELIQHETTGLHVRPGDAADLAAKLDYTSGNQAHIDRMRRAARAVFESQYTMERNYKILMEIYEKASCEYRTRKHAGK